MPVSSEPARRLRAADYIAEQRAAITALLERGGGDTVRRADPNSKGDTQIEVTVRPDSYALPTADAAYAKACELYNAACRVPARQRCSPPAPTPKGAKP